MTNAGTVRKNRAKKENLKKKHTENIKKQKANQDECIRTNDIKANIA